VGFNLLKDVTAVVTQGDSSSPQWVTQYTLQYSYNGTHYSKMMTNGETEMVNF